MSLMRGFAVLLAVAILGACTTTMPTGPSIAVMPGQGKTFETFQTDDAVCRQWATQQAKESPSEAGNRAGVGSAIAGTLLGAGLGAGIGAATGSVGAGAAIGGAAGLVGGSAVGSNRAESTRVAIQRQYDNAYEQCMYAKGNQVPGMMVQSYPTIPPPPPPPPAR
jgi:uncharacterized protein YcfJ